MGLGQKKILWVGSIFLKLRLGLPFLVWDWVWKISSKNYKFSIFSLWFKNNLFGMGPRRVGLLFTAGQKYGWARAHLYDQHYLRSTEKECCNKILYTTQAL